jgi:hypothetical protein
MEDTHSDYTLSPSFLKIAKKILPWIKEYSPYANVTEDDPPIFLEYKSSPAIGEAQRRPDTHLKFWS